MEQLDSANAGTSNVAATTTSDISNTVVTAPSVENNTQQTAQPNVAALLKDAPALNKDAWFSKLEDENLRGYAETRNWKSVDSVVKSYKELETLMGADKAGRGLVIPADESDAEGWNNVYSKLGKPSKAEDYKLEVPEGYDGKLTSEASKWMHEAGLNSKQAALINNKYNEYLSNNVQAMQAQIAERNVKEFEAVQKEWGQDFDRNAALAQRARQNLGIDDETLVKMENALGSGATIKLFERIGSFFTEDSFEGSNRSNAFGMSPEAARSRIQELTKDKEFSGRLIKGDVSAKREWENLNRISANGR